MGFSDKMRDSLGAEGARIEVDVPSEPTPAGGRCRAVVGVVGGNKDSHVDGFAARLVQAARTWTDASGQPVSEQAAMAADDRSSLQPSWTRTTVHEWTVRVDRPVPAGERVDVDLAFDVPEGAAASGPALNYTLLVQADIKGQIDPTGTAKVPVR